MLKSSVQSLLDEMETLDRPGAAEADFLPLGEGLDIRAHHEELDHYQRESILAQKAYEKGVEAASKGREAEAIEFFIKASKLAETSREWYIAAACCKTIGDYLIQPKPPVDYDRAFRMYRRAVAAYERCGLVAEARELSYAVMLWKLRRSRELGLSRFMQVELYLYWLTSGFGLRPLRVMTTAVAVIVLYGLAYWSLNGVLATQSSAPVDLLHAIYFSGITFATVGYGDFIPSPHVRLLSLSEGLLGSFTMGFFVAVLVNRLRQT